MMCKTHDHNSTPDGDRSASANMRSVASKAASGPSEAPILSAIVVAFSHTSGVGLGLGRPWLWRL